MVRALNPDAYPGDLSSATDDKGRFAMLGLRTRHVAVRGGCPGLPASGRERAGARRQQRRRCSSRSPATRVRCPTRSSSNVQQRLKEAATLRDAGQLDQALAAYQDIYAKNPRLTSVNLVLADVYRRKAAQAADVAARQALLNRAIDAYNEVLKIRRQQRERPRRSGARARRPRTRRLASRSGCQPAPRFARADGRPSASSSRWARWRSAPPPSAGGTRASRRRIRARSS